jgi:putative spermidine/putrescine transport system permease protein
LSLLVLSGLAALVHFTLLGLLAFLASVDNVPVSLFLSSARTDMLPLRLRGIMESTLDVRVAAVSGALIAVTFVLMVLMERLVGLTRRMRG